MTATVEFVCYRCQIRMKNNGDAATYVKSLYVCGQIDRSKRLDRVVLGLFIKDCNINRNLIVRNSNLHVLVF